MGEPQTFYIIYIKNSGMSLLKVLFYFDELKYWGEPDNIKKIKDAFMEKWYGKNDEIVGIEVEEELTEKYFNIVKN